MIISLSQCSKAEGIETIPRNQYIQAIFHARHMVLEGYDPFHGYHGALDLRGLGTLSNTAFIRLPSMSP